VGRATPQATQQQREWQVEPDHPVRRVGDQPVKLVLIVAVRDPAIGMTFQGGPNDATKLLGRWRTPVRSMVQRVELDMYDPEASGKLRG